MSISRSPNSRISRSCNNITKTANQTIEKDTEEEKLNDEDKELVGYEMNAQNFFEEKDNTGLAEDIQNKC